MKKILFLALGALAAFQTTPAHAYVLEGAAWAVPSFTVYLNLTASQGNLGANLARFPLADGSTSYDQVYANAEAIWNSYLNNLKISTVAGSNAQGVTMSNGLNEVGFSSTIQGYALSQYTLGLTLYYYNPSSNPGKMTQTSTAINPAWQWNSYRGNLTYPAMDLQRVALHESGHMIGLGHPDQSGQVVSAIMNSSVSNTDNLTVDDIAGGQQLYGAPQASPTPILTPEPSAEPTPTPEPPFWVNLLVSSANGPDFIDPATITLTATAGDNNGSITKVQYYNGNQKIGEANKPPYLFTWTNVHAGTYSLTARVLDNRHATAAGESITVLVAPKPTK